MLLAAVLLFGFNTAVKKAPQPTYTIDFLGSSFQSVGVPETPAPKAEEKKADPAPAPATAAKPEYAAKNEITTKPASKPAAKPKEKITLGAPSVLNDPKPAASGTGPAGDSGAKAMKTDFDNFPYPWYITQVRNALWTEWEKRRPKGVYLSASVSFAIQKDGNIKNVKAEKKSGDKEYDYAAISSATNSAPFPALPAEYDKQELTVTVEYKDER